jgi:hypothetical protein
MALASRDCVVADSPWTDVFGALRGNFLIGMLFLALWTLEWHYTIRLVGALLVAWNGMRLARATLSRRHWMVAASAERFYVRLFRPIGPGWRKNIEADVMALDMAELAAIQIRTTDVFVHGPKPKIYQWLVLEPVHGVRPSIADWFEHQGPFPPEVRPSAADQFEDLGPRSPGVYPVPAANRFYRQWFTRCEGGTVAVPWHRYRPGLEKFLRQIALWLPNLTIRPEAHTELDLISFVSKREPERRRLLAQAKRMGFSNDCVHALYSYTGPTLYSHRSLKDANEYMSTVDVGANEGAEP